MIRRPGPDGGQISLLLLGYTLLVAAVLFTAASATAVHLARHPLLAVADALALEAASALDESSFYRGAADGPPGTAGPVTLTSASVRAAVAARLGDSATGAGLPDARIGDPTGTPDGVTAEVTLETVVRLPLLPAALGRSPAVPVRVTARARVRQPG